VCSILALRIPLSPWIPPGGLQRPRRRRRRRRSGDGFDDLLVGAPGDNTQAHNAGAALLFLGTGL
jgi:hypothetical protein